MEVIYKIPQESSDYPEDSAFVIQRMEYNRLVCGDAIEEMSKLPDNCIDLIVADPPYNLGKDYGNNQDILDYLALYARDGQENRIFAQTRGYSLFY